jgi:hypothetical protein
MNQYAAQIAWVFSIALVIVLVCHLLLADVIYGKNSGILRFVALGLVSLVSEFVWGLLSSVMGAFFALCSFCFGPGTPQQRILYGIASFASYLLTDNNVIHFVWTYIGFALLALAFSLLIRPSLQRLHRFGLGLSYVGAVMTSILFVGLLVVVNILSINSDPYGLDSLVPSGAQNVNRTETAQYRMDDMPGLQIEYDTNASSQNTWDYYLSALPRSGWVHLTDEAELEEQYWRVSPNNNSLRLSITATTSVAGKTHMFLTLRNEFLPSGARSGLALNI